MKIKELIILGILCSMQINASDDVFDYEVQIKILDQTIEIENKTLNDHIKSEISNISQKINNIRENLNKKLLDIKKIGPNLVDNEMVQKSLDFFVNKIESSTLIMNMNYSLIIKDYSEFLKHVSFFKKYYDVYNKQMKNKTSKLDHIV